MDFLQEDELGEEFGGSDACLDMSDPDNGGLAECLIRGEHDQAIHTTYDQYCDRVSLADFFVIAAEAVMDITRRQFTGLNGNQPKVTVSGEKAALGAGMNFVDQFQFGRITKTAETCKYKLHTLPNPAHGCDDVETVFVDNIGLNRRETTALLGVHTLGRAHTNFSGWNGWWSDAPNSRLFNNNYYVSLIAKGWEPVEIAPGKIQWNRSDHERHLDDEMMLDSDVCLLYGDKMGEPLSASSGDEKDHCCAWVTSVLAEELDPNGEKMKKVIANNWDNFCGKPWTHFIGGAEEQGLCCEVHLGGLEHDCGGGEIGTGAVNPTGGWATTDVLDFAADDTIWLTEFKKAWQTATERGAAAGTLTALQ